MDKVADKHVVNGNRMKPPFPEGFQQAMFGEIFFVWCVNYRCTVVPAALQDHTFKRPTWLIRPLGNIQNDNFPLQ